MDVSVIRDNPEAIRAMLRNRTYSEDVLDRFLELDQAWRAAVDTTDGAAYPSGGTTASR